MVEDKSSKLKLRWQFGIIAGIVLAIFASYPQFKMWYLQGDDWQGHYAYNDIDEVAYASYLKALIDGRPRRNDPYTGRDDTTENPQPESLFSIQFAAPYTIAIPARIFGVPATWAMTLTGALAGFLAAFACFWLIGLLTRNSLYAMMGSLVVLCGGALAAGEGAIGEILGTGFSYPYFPFLRRYIPALGFPVFFALITSVWLLVKNEKLNQRILWCIISAFCFSYLVFTYFYIWTTAAAWLFCLVILWLVIRPRDWWKDFQGFIALGISCIIPLTFYAVMLSNRVDSMDNVQLLVNTREMDLWRFPQYISLFALIILTFGVLQKSIELKSRSTLFAISFVFVPFILFNQQIITGRSLQPIHYQVFIGNYVAGLALTVSIGLVFRGFINKNSTLSKIIILIVSVLAIIWGFVECHYTVRVLDDANIARDQGMPLAKRLTELSKEKPNPYQQTIFSLTNIQADDSPTIAPQNVLWSRHQHVFAGLSWQESKERYYQFLYYQNLDEKWLESRLKNGDFVSMIAVFGWGRHTKRLSSEAKPLTFGEINREVKQFGDYYKDFSFEQAANPALSYLVLPRDQTVNFNNLDKWYERYAKEEIGIYTLYKLKLKTVNSAE
ncbi:MAG: hypothetical protein M3405_10125 [Acidobacteriota bacterium]|jgi:hypothetical protein|nr:hypothetical protein [Acidobacteriota bacterium]